jgi:hypothetical protein
MQHELILRIVLLKPPAGVDFGLQKGRGSTYETIQNQRSADKDLYFEFKVSLKPKEDPIPDFLGPFVQGPTGQRFVYIDIGTYAGQTNTHWSRRLKIPLKGITWNMADQLLNDPKMILEAWIPGTGQDGGPTCGTVKPFDGWKLASTARSKSN